MMTRFRRWWNGSAQRPARTAQLRLEAMESREVPAALTAGAISVAHTGGTVDSTVQFLNAFDNGPRLPTITPFAGYHGTLAVSQGDVNHDFIADVIVGAQAPNGHVKVFDGRSGNLLWSFLAFPGFNGAVNVGAADVDGDRFDDVLVSANATNGHVKAFSGRDGSLLSSFLAFPGFLGQITVSGGDFDRDGFDEIIVGAGAPGVGGRVAIFNSDGSVFDPGFVAFPGFDGGISVAAADLNNDGIADIVVGAGAGGPGGHVKAFSGLDFTLLDSFLAFSPGTLDGILVATGDADHNGRPDILTTMQGGRVPGVWVFDAITGMLLNSPSGTGNIPVEL